ncbi:hypothetical protein OZN62_02575 [Aurantiacibacter sp. MUD11]|uniref:hypothetical protein n=1 Tax=Aurantiacibacter sp. MUD11 TaxID=3003265 RepID=UPI0022AB3D32|nr:hypothetical protein [Aurantiacibacter sp. MUD11]WAT18485.1 hypothetical protein OZN62_02575 [Aurantiacibacter sp. MUD11]
MGDRSAIAEGKRTDGPPRRHVPRENRERTEVSGLMQCEYATPQEVVVRDISQFGVGATTHGQLPDIGEHVCITLATGDELRGQVRWTDGQAFGLHLESAFDLGRLQHINRLRSRLLADPAETAQRDDNRG